MKIQGAIFDMDGTLVDSLSFWDCFWRDMGECYFDDPTFRMDAAHFDSHVRTMIFSQAISYIHGYLKIPCAAEEFSRFASDYIENFYRTAVTPKAGAKELLTALREGDVKMCLASATDRRYLNIALESCGLARFFTPETILSCSDLGVGKDRPDIYLAALQTLETTPDKTAVFEDSFVALETAKSIGLHTVGVFDRYNGGQERLRAASDIYLGEGSSLDGVIDRIEVAEKGDGK